MTESMQSVGIRIKELREKQSLTRQDLASYIGRDVSEKEVQTWEEQSVFPGFEKFDELTDVLGTSLDYLLSGKKGYDQQIYFLPDVLEEIEEKLQESELSEREKNKYRLMYRQFVAIMEMAIEQPKRVESFIESMAQTWRMIQE